MKRAARIRVASGLLCGALICLAALFLYGVVQAKQGVGEALLDAEAAKIRHLMDEYRRSNGTFPPRFLADPGAGTVTFWPMLLEVADRSEPGSDYRIDKAWDSAANLAAFERTRTVVCTAPVRREGRTLPAASFVAVNDIESILFDGRGISADDVADGCENTLVVAQVLSPRDPWGEPRSLSFAEFEALCGGDDNQRAGGERLVGFAGQRILFGDGKIFSATQPLPAAAFWAMWSRSGGEGVTRAELVERGLLSARGR